jgi:hypothetical protein
MFSADGRGNMIDQQAGATRKTDGAMAARGMIVRAHERK